MLERGGRATPLLAAREGELPAADRGLLRELVLGVLRHRASLDAELAGVCRVPLERLTPDLREILEIALYQLRHLDRVPDYAAVDEAVKLARARGGDGGARLVNAVLRNTMRHPPRLSAAAVAARPAAEGFKTEPGGRAGRGRRPRFAKRAAGRGEGGASATDLAVQFSHPLFLVERWLSRFGPERTLAILRADNSPSGLDLMVNPLKTDRESLRRALEEEGTETHESDLSPLALSVISGNPLRSVLFAEGHFTIQDLGSQALPLLLPPGETLVDLAAAPGGKSFAALALGRARRAISIDHSAERLLLLVQNRERLGFPEACPVSADVRSLPLLPRSAERILFDAPCSGTGTLRKNPEIRYRVRPAAVERLSRAQEEGLEAAAALLATGGFLLYSTCSLEEEENERVVERVLARDPGLEPAPIEAPGALGAHVEGARFRIFPDEHSDGFTAHLLRRKA